MPYKKKPNNRRRRPARKRVYRKKNIVALANKQALALKITKKKESTIIERPFGQSPVVNEYQAGTSAQTLSGVLTDSRHWSVFNPLYLPATQGQHEPTDREDMRIYANNCQAEIEL